MLTKFRRTCIFSKMPLCRRVTRLLTKLRNRMLLTLLSSLLRIRMHFFCQKIYGTSFNSSADLLKDFTSHVLYTDQNEVSETETSETLIDKDEIEVLQGFEDYDWPWLVWVSVCDISVNVFVCVLCIHHVIYSHEIKNGFIISEVIYHKTVMIRTLNILW